MDEGPRAPLESMTRFNTALIPVPSLEQDSYHWYARHFAVLAFYGELCDHGESKRKNVSLRKAEGSAQVAF